MRGSGGCGRPFVVRIIILNNRRACETMTELLIKRTRAEKGYTSMYICTLIMPRFETNSLGYRVWGKRYTKRVHTRLPRARSNTFDSTGRVPNAGLFSALALCRVYIGRVFGIVHLATILPTTRSTLLVLVE